MEIPEGWKLVPMEPTKEMVSADVTYPDNCSQVPYGVNIANYKAMVAAAPAPPGKDG